MSAVSTPLAPTAAPGSTPSGIRYPDRRADVAQLVEHQLPKLRVAGSNPVVRSDEIKPPETSDRLCGEEPPRLASVDT